MPQLGHVSKTYFCITYSTVLWVFQYGDQSLTIILATSRRVFTKTGLKKKTVTGNRTRVSGFKTRSPNHYSIVATLLSGKRLTYITKILSLVLGSV